MNRLGLSVMDLESDRPLFKNSVVDSDPAPLFAVFIACYCCPPFVMEAVHLIYSDT